MRRMMTLNLMGLSLSDGTGWWSELCISRPVQQYCNLLVIPIMLLVEVTADKTDFVCFRLVV